MDVMTRDALRTAVIEKLLADFPKAQKVAGGVAFMSETLDEETGLYFPVEIKVSVKNTQATARSEAYDFEKAVADFAAKPGRRVADPAKKAERDVAKAEAAAKKAAEDEAKAQAERDAAEAERKFNLDKLVELRAQEQELSNKLNEAETYAAMAPEYMKEAANKPVEEIRTSLGNIRENIASIEALINGGTEVPAVSAPTVTPSVAKKLTKKERKALRKSK